MHGLPSLAILTSLVLVSSPAAQAQTSTAKRLAMAELAVENATVRVEMKDIVSDAEFCKLRFKVVNKGDGFVFVDPNKFKVMLGGKAMVFAEKAFVLGPHDEASRTLNVMGEGGYRSEQLAIDFADGFQTATAKGEVAALEDFSLPAAKNQVSSGAFTVNLRGLDQQTKKTVAKFSVTYGGISVGIVDPSKIGVRIPAGQTFANLLSKSKPNLIEGGGSDNFEVVAEIPAKVVDMQFTTLTVVWNDAMVESHKQPLAVDAVTFAIDAAKTAAMNK